MGWGRQEEMDENWGQGDAEVVEEAKEKRTIYHHRLPMLNGSSHRDGLGDAAGWSGRTVEVGIVMQRWVTFTSTEL